MHAVSKIWAQLLFIMISRENAKGGLNRIVGQTSHLPNLYCVGFTFSSFSRRGVKILKMIFVGYLYLIMNKELSCIYYLLPPRVIQLVRSDEVYLRSHEYFKEETLVRVGKTGVLKQSLESYSFFSTSAKSVEIRPLAWVCWNQCATVPCISGRSSDPAPSPPRRIPCPASSSSSSGTRPRSAAPALRARFWKRNECDYTFCSANNSNPRHHFRVWSR